MSINRDNKGRFAKTKAVVRKLIVYSFIAGLVWGAFQIGSNFYGKPVYAVKEVMSDSLGKKTEEIKQEALADIKKCESAGLNESDGIIIFDSNAKASIGTYQFQKLTVIHYYKELYNEDITPKEAVLIALDDEKAGKLAYDVIFKTKNGLKNWINCSNKIELRKTLELIEKLEK